MWTEFWDMHSGGSLKEKFHYCYIEASVKEAEIIFYNKFGHNPHRVSCTCCGSDYSVTEYKTLKNATELQMKDGRNKTLKEFEKRKDVLIIRKKDIKPEDKVGNLPVEGYVWM